VRLALASTPAALAPGAVACFRVAARALPDGSSAVAPAAEAAAEARSLLLALSSSAWAFFLFSYQVRHGTSRCVMGRSSSSRTRCRRGGVTDSSF
jgi:hypothetical protein